MSAIRATEGSTAVSAAVRTAEKIPGAPPPGLALSFADGVLAEQRVPLLARRTAARALGLLLERSHARPGEPVVLSALDAARACGFTARTWWLVKRRLLEKGHLLASAGGGPPSGRPGGRGHKAAYFVAPKTLERFQQTLNARPQTVKALPQTLNAPREERNLSHHRSLRLLEKERTSDVPSFEGDELPSPRAIWAEIRRESSLRAKLGLLRLLESLLLTEALERLLPRSASTVNAPVNDGVNAPAETVHPSPNQGERREHRGAPGERRPRSGTPLWSGAAGEEKDVYSWVERILEWSNREHGASFQVTRSSQDTLLYPFERVRAAVSNVLLKRARGYRFANPGAVLWDAITLEGYKLDEFSVGPWDEVLRRSSIRATGGSTASRATGGSTAVPVKKTVTATHPKSPDPAFSAERRRRELLQLLYEKLPERTRADLDRRAEALAREELGEKGSELRLALRRLDKRNDLLAAEHRDAMGGSLSPEESQFSDSGSPARRD